MRNDHAFNGCGGCTSGCSCATPRFPRFALLGSVKSTLGYQAAYLGALFRFPDARPERALAIRQPYGVLHAYRAGYTTSQRIETIFSTVLIDTHGRI